MSFALIDRAKAEFPVHRLCRVLGASQSGYFAWRAQPACRRQHDDMVLLAHVRSAFALSNSTYGSPRLTRELQDSGLTVDRRRIARLMRDNGLRARQKRRFKRTTDSHHAWPVAPNLLDQDFTATGPDKKWGADISYVWTREGWLYLAVVIDLFARRVVGWATGDRSGRFRFQQLEFWPRLDPEFCPGRGRDPAEPKPPRRFREISRPLATRP